MKIVLQQWLKCKKAVALEIVVIILTAIALSLSSLNVAKMSEGLEHPEMLVKNLLVVLALLGAEAIISPIYGYLQSLTQQLTMKQLSREWYGNIIDADFKMFTKYSCSKVYTTGTFLWDCTKLMSSMSALIRSFIQIIVSLYGMYALGGKIVIPVAIVYGTSAILLKYLMSTYRKIDGECAKNTHARNQACEDMINGFAEVRSFGYQDSIRNDIFGNLDTAFMLSMRKHKLGTKIGLCYYMIDVAGTGIVFAYAMRQITLGAMTSGVAVSMILYLWRIIDPIDYIANFLGNLSDSTKFANDYQEILNYANKIKNGDIDMSSFEDCISINNVSFAYKESSTVLRNISMKIHKGEHVGICGASGNGKSTLAKLLLHFYEPTQGTVNIDGINLTDMTDSSFRKLVGAVQQDNVIFPGSIMKNITYGTNNVLEAEIIDACKRAKIYDFIMSLDNKFETEVGPRGLDLSGGQKQRIALARLFLKNPEIIILDEATSALDNETESFVKEAIEELTDKTVITIAHRLTTIENCDQIYVLDHGMIVEHGSHGELMALNGKYAEMQNAQGRKK